MATHLKTATHPGFMLPIPHLIDIETADLKASRYRSWTIPANQRSKDAIPQILRIRLHPDLPSRTG